jgi:hypothetical protein
MKKNERLLPLLQGRITPIRRSIKDLICKVRSVLKGPMEENIYHIIEECQQEVRGNLDIDRPISVHWVAKIPTSGDLPVISCGFKTTEPVKSDAEIMIKNLRDINADMKGTNHLSLVELSYRNPKKETATFKTLMNVMPAWRENAKLRARVIIDREITSDGRRIQVIVNAIPENASHKRKANTDPANDKRNRTEERVSTQDEQQKNA